MSAVRRKFYLAVLAVGAWQGACQSFVYVEPGVGALLISSLAALVATASAAPL